MSLQSKASEWKSGESDPSEFTAEAVADVVSDEKTSDEEVSRIGAADDRQTVQNAVEARSGSGDESDSESSDSEPGVSPDYAKADDTPIEELDIDEILGDTKVDSSVLRETILLETAGGGESPTLDAIREAQDNAK